MKHTINSIIKINDKELSKFSRHGKIIVANYAKNQFNKIDNKKSIVYVPIM